MTTNYKIEKLIKRSIGYTLFTISSVNGYKKIAVKKNLLKDNYKLIFYNEDIASIEEKTISNITINDNILTIGTLGGYIIRDVNYSLRKPNKTIISDNEIYRSIDRIAREEEMYKSNEAQREIVRFKDEQIKKLKEDFEKKEIHYTTGKTKRLRNNTESLLTATIKHSSYDYEMVNKGASTGGYQMESNSNTYEISKNYGIEFVVMRLEEISKSIGSDAFEENRLNSLANKCDVLFNTIENGYDEKTVDSIQAIYGLMAEELTIRLYKLYNYINKNNIDTKSLKYNKLVYTNTSNYYEEEHSVTEYEVIDNYFDSVFEAACTFIERVTGKNIKSELTLPEKKSSSVVYIK